jgi:hypothetical protein
VTRSVPRRDLHRCITGVIDSWLWASAMAAPQSSRIQRPHLRRRRHSAGRGPHGRQRHRLGYGDEGRGYIEAVEPVAAAFSASVAAGVMQLVVTFSDLSSGGFPPHLVMGLQGQALRPAEPSTPVTRSTTPCASPPRGVAVDVEQAGYIAAGFIDPADQWATPHPRLRHLRASLRNCWDKATSLET